MSAPSKNPGKKKNIAGKSAQGVATAGRMTAVPPTLKNEPWRIAAVCVALAVITMFSFRGVRTNDFLSYDDKDYVLQNRQVHQGLTQQSISWAFTTFHESNWHPLTWISHMVDWKFYGKNPCGHHMTNVYLHTANAILLFLLLLYMTGFLWRAAMVAFLFALHPAHVESVAWISERKDVLSVFFWSAALLAYVWYVRRPSWKRFAWVICSFACGLMSKPMVVTLPFTLLLLDYWPLRRMTFGQETQKQWSHSPWKLCVEKWPLFLMSAVSCVITFFAQKAGGAVIQLQHLPLWERICNAAMSYCRYALKMFWPDPLMVYYHHEKNNVMISAAVLSAIVLCLITAGCWYVRKNRPYCLIGWLWYLGTLVPVIGIVQVGVQAMAERYTYIPSIGLFVAIVWFIGDATAKTPKIRAGTQLLAGAVIIACAVKTDAQVKVWKDTVTLFSHVLAIDPRGEFPNLSMGAAYLRQGRLAEAQEYFKRALEYNPFEPQTLSYSAFCLMQTHEQHNLEVARQRLERALSVSPNNRHALINMAEWCLLTGRPKDAETYCKKVIPMDPDSLTARLYLADALQAQEKLDEAIQAYRQALVIDPNNYDTHNNLGILFGRQGSMEEALKEFRLSLAIKPDQTMAHSNIGRILMERHQLTEAVNEFTQALKFDPSNAIAHNNLGMAWFQLGDYEKAVEHFSEAVRFDSTYADAKRNLDIAQLRMKTGNVENGKK